MTSSSPGAATQGRGGCRRSRATGCRRAVQDAVELTGAFASVRGLDDPIFVFSVRDRITASDGSIRAVVVAVQSRCSRQLDT